MLYYNSTWYVLWCRYEVAPKEDDEESGEGEEEEEEEEEEVTLFYGEEEKKEPTEKKEGPETAGYIHYHCFLKITVFV